MWKRYEYMWMTIMKMLKFKLIIVLWFKLECVFAFQENQCKGMSPCSVYECTHITWNVVKVVWNLISY